MLCTNLSINLMLRKNIRIFYIRIVNVQKGYLGKNDAVAHFKIWVEFSVSDFI